MDGLDKFVRGGSLGLDLSIRDNMVLDGFVDSLNENQLVSLLDRGLEVKDVLLADYYLDFGNYRRASNMMKGDKDKRVDYFERSFRLNGFEEAEFKSSVELNSRLCSFLDLIENEDVKNLARGARSREDLKSLILSDMVYSGLDERRDEILSNGYRPEEVAGEFLKLRKAISLEREVNEDIERVLEYKGRLDELFNGINITKAREIVKIEDRLRGYEERYECVDYLDLERYRASIGEVQRFIDEGKCFVSRVEDVEIDKSRVRDYIKDCERRIGFLKKRKEVCKVLDVDGGEVGESIKSVRRRLKEAREVDEKGRKLLRGVDGIEEKVDKFLRNKGRVKLSNLSRRIYNTNEDIGVLINGAREISSGFLDVGVDAGKVVFRLEEVKSRMMDEYGGLALGYRDQVRELSERELSAKVVNMLLRVEGKISEDGIFEEHNGVLRETREVLNKIRTRSGDASFDVRESSSVVETFENYEDCLEDLGNRGDLCGAFKGDVSGLEESIKEVERGHGGVSRVYDCFNRLGRVDREVSGYKRKFSKGLSGRVVEDFKRRRGWLDRIVKGCEGHLEDPKFSKYEDVREVCLRVRGNADSTREYVLDIVDGEVSRLREYFGGLSLERSVSGDLDKDISYVGRVLDNVKWGSFFGESVGADFNLDGIKEAYVGHWRFFDSLDKKRRGLRGLDRKISGLGRGLKKNESLENVKGVFSYYRKNLGHVKDCLSDEGLKSYEDYYTMAVSVGEDLGSLFKQGNDVVDDMISRSRGRYNGIRKDVVGLMKGGGFFDSFGRRRKLGKLLKRSTDEVVFLDYWGGARKGRDWERTYRDCREISSRIRNGRRGHGVNMLKDIGSLGFWVGAGVSLACLGSMGYENREVVYDKLNDVKIYVEEVIQKE